MQNRLLLPPLFFLFVSCNAADEAPNPPRKKIVLSRRNAALAHSFTTGSLNTAAVTDEPYPSHRRTSKLRIDASAPRRTLTVSSVSTTMVNGELVKCIICGSKHVTESITVDDATHGFCNDHKDRSESKVTGLPGSPEEKDNKE